MSPYIPSHVFYSLRPFPYHLFNFFLISIGRNIITLSSSSPIQVSLTQLHPLDTCELFMVASRWVLVGGETQGLKGSRTPPCVSLPTGTHLQLHPYVLPPFLLPSQHPLAILLYHYFHPFLPLLSLPHLSPQSFPFSPLP